MRLLNPTGRRTEARVLDMERCRLYFSYETLIAFEGCEPDGTLVKVRRVNSWGPTTGKHFRELGCADFEVKRVDDFDNTVRRCLGSL